MLKDMKVNVRLVSLTGGLYEFKGSVQSILILGAITETLFNTQELSSSVRIEFGVPLPPLQIYLIR